ncbi:class I SAM-dependent methyltransferase [Chloroflexota bacterium]
MKRATSDKRFQLAQESERDYWENLWKGIGDRQSQANEYWQHYIGLLGKHARLRLNSKVLDIGCGPCGMINYLDLGQKYALDSLMDFYLSSFDMPKDVKWVAGRGEDIPFKDCFFDTVITTNCIEHVKNPDRVLSEINRILKENQGFLFLTVNACSWWAKYVKVFLETIGLGTPSHLHIFTATAVRQMLSRSGFTIIGILHGIGDLGVSTGGVVAMKESIPTITRGNIVKAIDILRKEGCKTLLRRLIRLSLLNIFGASRWPRDSIFLAIKRPPVGETPIMVQHLPSSIN